MDMTAAEKVGLDKALKDEQEKKKIKGYNIFHSVGCKCQKSKC